MAIHFRHAERSSGAERVLSGSPAEWVTPRADESARGSCDLRYAKLLAGGGISAALPVFRDY